MRFQERDGDILQVIYANNGVLARRQLKALFWPNKTWRAMDRRLAKLHLAGYIDWPSREHYKNNPIPEPVCWLQWKGALFVAGRQGIEVAPPKNDNENQMRLLQNRLRERGFRWVREPRWSLLAHDLAVVDFRLAVEKAIHEIPFLVLENWLNDSIFRSDPDVITYNAKDKNGNFKHMKKGVCPDAYFEIVDEERRVKGEPHRARFLLELDMATHDNPSFGREKAAPGVAYIESPAYRERFGNNSGRWLVVTRGRERRLRNMMQQTRESAGPGAKMFFFTTFDQLETGNVLTSPIWWRVGWNEPGPLLSG